MATRSYTFTDGSTAYGSQVETELNEIFTNITNANISASAAIAISKTELGTYTAWTNWTPTFTASGSMTIGSLSISIARYCQIGKIVYFQVYASMTTGGTASNAIKFTLPLSPLASADNKIGGGCWVIDTTAVGGLFGWQNGTTVIQCFKYDSSNFGLGASRAVNVQGFYEVA
jgi:hypothetical protein